ncbi:hypothetical protein [Streptomyces sp. NPDC047000]|uniref:hypothetical protein n=1 Tax=Streptomyces sp. NPDC047000 TaxID=3155474 RepID=UPI0033DF4143
MNATTPDESSSPQAKMTLRVYTVDRYGAVTGERRTVSVPHGQELPLLMSPTPPCACIRCVAARSADR